LRRIILGAGSRGKEAERKVQTDAEILFKGPGATSQPRERTSARLAAWMRAHKEKGPAEAEPEPSRNQPAKIDECYNLMPERDVAAPII
jgi:hypothetical protein